MPLLMHRAGRASACGLMALFGITARLAGQAQAGPEVIRGTVKGDGGKPVVAAQITATRAPDRAYFQATTDSAGRYEIVVPVGTGDYLLHAAATGYQRFVKRLLRGTESGAVIVADIMMTLTEPVALETVRIAAPRVTISRSENANTGAAESRPEVVFAAIGPAERGDLAAIASTLPGITVTPDGISVLGIPAAQNATTLNSMAFDGASVPRDAPVSVSVATSTYDPSRGWFGGAETRVSIEPGELFSIRHSSLSIDAPALQGGDALTAKLGQRYSNVIAGLGGSGMMAGDWLAFSYGAQLGRRSADASTLGSADADVLTLAGVVPDSAARLVGLLGQNRIPFAMPRAERRVTQQGSFLARFNSPLHDARLEEAKRNGGVIVYASHQATDAVSASPLSTAAHDGRLSSTLGMVQGVYSSYANPRRLHEVRTAVSVGRQTASPYLRLPSGRVLVESLLPGGDQGLASLGFGGAPATAFENRSFTWQTQLETKFSPATHPTHRMRLNGDLRFDAVSRHSDANRFGTFSFNSLADVAAGRPSAFSRTLAVPDRDAGVWNGFVSFGDYWRATPGLQVLYGVRLEGNRYATQPAFNPLVERQFGVRTDGVPNTMHVSPRLGFTWTYQREPGGGFVTQSPIGTLGVPTTGVLRGGIGEFRSMLSPGAVADVAATTGLPDATRRIACVGDAVPTPDWTAYMVSPDNAPSDCLTSAGTLRDAAPGVALFDREFTAPRSWRANLTWSRGGRRLVTVFSAVAALNVDQPSTVDLNFADTPRFSTADERRPVYVSPSGIATASGAISPVEARRTADLGRVVLRSSRAASHATQLGVTLLPQRGPLFSAFSYTFGNVRSRATGFDGSTFDSPLDLGWGRGDFDVRHTLLVQAGRGWRYANATLFGRLTSGMPFTPVVNGDVNGDGLANDRAYIFDPARLSDRELAGDLDALIARAPGNVRRCLLGQLGRAAARNSCEGPWTSDLSARIALNARNISPRASRVSAAIYLRNVLGAFDQLFHGSNLRGWGVAPLPDPALLQVVGFDPAAARFKYVVNPRFGDTRPSSTTFRVPYRITLDVRIDVGRAVENQQVDRFLRPGRDGHPGEKLTATDLKDIYARSVPNPYSRLIYEADSLLLSRSQVDSLRAAQRAYAPRVDSIWARLASELAELPDKFDAATVIRRQRQLIDEAWNLGRAELQSVLPGVLTPIQLKILPYPANYFFNATKPIAGPYRVSY